MAIDCVFTSELLSYCRTHESLSVLQKRLSLKQKNQDVSKSSFIFLHLMLSKLLCLGICALTFPFFKMSSSNPSSTQLCLTSITYAALLLFKYSLVSVYSYLSAETTKHISQIFKCFLNPNNLFNHKRHQNCMYRNLQ